MAKTNYNAVFAVATGAVAISVVAVTMVLERRHRQRQRQAPKDTVWFSQAGLQRFALGKAAVFVLDDLNRANLGGLGGAGVLQCSDTAEDVSIEAMMDVPGLVLYSIEIIDGEVLLLFMQVPSLPELFDTPFLDRGVRAVAATGSKIYVARMSAMKELPGFVPLDELTPRQQSRFSIVWNTGRCGSTLMHRMLHKVGVLSYSEPYWLEVICQLGLEGFDKQMIVQIFGTCGALDVMLARKAMPAHVPVSGASSRVGRGHVTFNPKAMCCGVMEPIARAMPHARHMLMYRDALKVAESFGSIFHKPASRFAQLTAWLPWKIWKRSHKFKAHVERKDGPMFSRAVFEARAAGTFTQPSRSIPKSVAFFWLEVMSVWREILDSGVLAEGAALTLRMDEFIRQDPEMIKDILTFVLGGEADVGKDVITTALEVFNKHSQEGDRMAASSHHVSSKKPRFLTAEDTEQIITSVAGVPTIGRTDFVFPESLGAQANPAA